LLRSEPLHILLCCNRPRLDEEPLEIGRRKFLPISVDQNVLYPLVGQSPSIWTNHAELIIAKASDETHLGRRQNAPPVQAMLSQESLIRITNV